MAMTTPVLITVDTELTWGHYARGATWRENFDRSYDPAGVGVPHQLRLLAEHGLKACFFVDPMPAMLYGLEPVRRMLDPILAAGQEVQLHLHSFWASLADGLVDRPVFELTGLDGERQRALIATARDLLILAGAPRPIAFRSGSYAADAATIAALTALDFAYDSSHNGSHHPWPSALPLDSELIAPVALGGLIEVPVTQIGQRAGGLRHLQLCAVSSAEMEAALLHAAAHGHALVTIVGHSFELAARSGLRPNRTVCRRFERLCRFLADRRGRLPTTAFSALGNVPLGRSDRPMPPRALRTAGRVAQQLWSNAVYERAL